MAAFPSKRVANGGVSVIPSAVATSITFHATAPINLWVNPPDVLGVGWIDLTAGAGVIVGFGTSTIMQENAVVETGKTYRVMFELNGSVAGSLAVSIGGGDAATITTTGSHSNDIVCGGTESSGIQFAGTGFSCQIFSSSLVVNEL